MSSTTLTSRPRAGFPAAITGSLRQPGFVACVLALGVLTAAFYGLTWKMKLRKLPAPLRVPLGLLDKARLDPPYRFLGATTINPEVLDSLGTDQYIQWSLADDSRTDSDDPTSQVSLFITFYTGQPDPVPHVPDACYSGAGFQIKGSHDDQFLVPELGREIPMRTLELEKTKRTGTERTFVTYLFGVNGGFAADRNEVRTMVGRPWESYSYFSKVEVRFWSRTGAAPSREQAIEAAKRLLKKLVPILVDTHWPDWKALHEKPAPAGS